VNSWSNGSTSTYVLYPPSKDWLNQCASLRSVGWTRPPLIFLSRNRDAVVGKDLIRAILEALYTVAVSHDEAPLVPETSASVDDSVKDDARSVHGTP
jgi:hypothetical protein